jgi:hypothetical protein
MKNSDVFWVTNISNMNVSLADLNVTIKARSSVNLLDKKHFSLSKEQLSKSFATGSLLKKRNKIFVRQVVPEIENTNLLFNRNESFPSRDRSILSIKEENYEELNLSDSEYADQNAELAEMDSQPLIRKG